MVSAFNHFCRRDAGLRDGDVIHALVQEPKVAATQERHSAMVQPFFLLHHFMGDLLGVRPPTVWCEPDGPQNGSWGDQSASHMDPRMLLPSGVLVVELRPGVISARAVTAQQFRRS